MFRSSFGLFNALLDAIDVTQDIKENTSWREFCPLSSPIISSGFCFLSGERKTAQDTPLSLCSSFFFIFTHTVRLEKYGVAGFVIYPRLRIMRLCGLYIYPIISLCSVGDTIRYTKCIVPFLAYISTHITSSLNTFENSLI